MTTLRDRLRVETAPLHDRVDRAYSSLDLRQPDDLGTFLAAQRSVLRAIRVAAGPHAGEARAVSDRMAEALDADLDHLGVRQGAAPAMTDVHATACLYILLGSGLGTRVLHRRWSESRDALAAGAGRYLGLAAPTGAWRGLCADLADRPSHDPDADHVVRDAIGLFGLHLVARDSRADRAEGALHA